MSRISPGDDIHYPDGVKRLIDDLEARMKGLDGIIAAYRSGPKDPHTLCFIAISEGQLDELAKVVHRLRALRPTEQAI